MNCKHTRIGVAAILLFSPAALAACADDGPNAGSEAGIGAASAPAGGIKPGDTVEFLAGEFMFVPADFIAAPGTYTGVLINDGAIEHDIIFEGGDAIVAGAGESVEFEFTVPEDGVRYWCSIPGHEEAGMVGFVDTSSSAAPAEPADDSRAASAAMPAVVANP